MSDQTKREAPRVVAAPVSAEAIAFARLQLATVVDPYTDTVQEAA